MDVTLEHVKQGLDREGFVVLDVRSLRERLFVYADNFYADWLPLLFLGLLLVRVPGCWPLALLHVLVLRSGLRQTWQDLRGHRAARAA